MAPRGQHPRGVLLLYNERLRSLNSEVLFFYTFASLRIRTIALIVILQDLQPVLRRQIHTITFLYIKGFIEFFKLLHRDIRP